jgi:hypothetical protein
MRNPLCRSSARWPRSRRGVPRAARRVIRGPAPGDLRCCWSGAGACATRRPWQPAGPQKSRKIFGYKKMRNPLCPSAAQHPRSRRGVDRAARGGMRHLPPRIFGSVDEALPPALLPARGNPLAGRDRRKIFGYKKMRNPLCRSSAQRPRSGRGVPQAARGGSHRPPPGTFGAADKALPPARLPARGNPLAGRHRQKIFRYKMMSNPLRRSLTQHPRSGRRARSAAHGGMRGHGVLSRPVGNRREAGTTDRAASIHAC